MHEQRNPILTTSAEFKRHYVAALHMRAGEMNSSLSTNSDLVYLVKIPEAKALD